MLTFKLTRRTMLRQALIAGAAGLVAGCTPKAPAPTAVAAATAVPAAKEAPAATAAPAKQEEKVVATAAPKPASAEVIKIRWVGWENNEFYGLDKVAEGFREKNPNVQAEYQFIPENFTQKLTAMMAGGDPPEIFDVNDDYVLTYACQDIVSPLDDYLETSPMNTKRDDYWPYFWGCVDMSPWGYGKFVGAPISMWSWFMVVNLDMFEKEGVQLPPNDWSDGNGYWTNDNMIEISKKLTKDTNGDGKIDQYGISIFHSTGCEQIWAVNNGGALYASDGKKFRLQEPEGSSGMQYLADLSVVHKVHPDPAMMREIGANDLFASGRLGILFNGASVIPDVKKKVGDKFRWAVAAIPKGTKDNYHEGATQVFCMRQQCKYPQETWDVLEYTMSEEGQKIIGTLGFGFPVTPEWARKYYLKPDEMPVNGNLVVDAYDHYISIPKTTNTEKARMMYRPVLSRGYAGEVKMAEGLAEVAAEIDRLLVEPCVK